MEQPTLDPDEVLRNLLPPDDYAEVKDILRRGEQNRSRNEDDPRASARIYAIVIAVALAAGGIIESCSNDKSRLVLSYPSIPNSKTE